MDGMLFPPVSGELVTDVPRPPAGSRSVGKATGSMAVAGLISKITGLSALLNALLNARHVFGITVWAPVANNVIVLATFGIYPLLPNTATADPSRIDSLHLLVLGIGSTLGVLVQVAVMLPSVLRSGFRFRWRWGFDRRFAEFGRLAAWAFGYALLAQIGVVVVTNVATANGGLTIYTNVWLLVQLPYGIIGFALITAILPRMSRSAADGRMAAVKNDLSLANRLCSVTMLPISALMTVLGPSLGIALFSVGQSHGQAGSLGLALAFAAFGANSFAFVFGWIVGEIWLRIRIGSLGSRRLLRTLTKSVVASAVAVGLALAVHALAPAGLVGSWVSLVGGGILGLAAAVGILALLKAGKLRAVSRRVLALIT